MMPVDRACPESDFMESRVDRRRSFTRSDVHAMAAEIADHRAARASLAQQLGAMEARLAVAIIERDEARRNAHRWERKARGYEE